MVAGFSSNAFTFLLSHDSSQSSNAQQKIFKWQILGFIGFFLDQNYAVRRYRVRILPKNISLFLSAKIYPQSHGEKNFYKFLLSTESGSTQTHKSNGTVYLSFSHLTNSTTLTNEEIVALDRSYRSRRLKEKRKISKISFDSPRTKNLFYASELYTHGSYVLVLQNSDITQNDIYQHRNYYWRIWYAYESRTDSLPVVWLWLLRK